MCVLVFGSTVATMLTTSVIECVFIYQSTVCNIPDSAYCTKGVCGAGAHLVDDGALNGLDGHSVLNDTKHARALAGRRAHTAGEFWEVVGLQETVQGVPPLALKETD